jgi:hydroxyacylglutathione hydrolase
MYASLQKLASLPDETLVYCTHEYTLSNIRFASAIDASNPALAQRVIEVEEQRKHDIPTLPSILAIEKATNPFLRCNQSAIIHAATQHSRKILSDPLSVFTEIRKWKDTF